MCCHRKNNTAFTSQRIDALVIVSPLFHPHTCLKVVRTQKTNENASQHCELLDDNTIVLSNTNTLRKTH